MSIITVWASSQPERAAMPSLGISFRAKNPVVMVLWLKTLQQLPTSNIEFSKVHNSAVLWAIFDEKEAPDRKSMSATRWKGRNAFISDKTAPK